MAAAPEARRASAMTPALPKLPQLAANAAVDGLLHNARPRRLSTIVKDDLAPPTKLLHHYHFGGVLGTGTFGTVFLATDARGGGLAAARARRGERNAPQRHRGGTTRRRRRRARLSLAGVRVRTPRTVDAAPPGDARPSNARAPRRRRDVWPQTVRRRVDGDPSHSTRGRNERRRRAGQAPAQVPLRRGAQVLPGPRRARVPLRGVAPVHRRSAASSSRIRPEDASRRRRRGGVVFSAASRRSPGGAGGHFVAETFNASSRAGQAVRVVPRRAAPVLGRRAARCR